MILKDYKKQIQELPSAIDSLKDLLTHVGKRQPAVFLDYDGTLTPIVDDPIKAVLDDKVRTVIRELSSRCVVGVISGRDRADVASKVNIDTIVYAGSHGYDISGPSINYLHEKGVECLPALDKAEDELIHRLKPIQGARVDRKKFAIAIHYRHVLAEEVPVVLSIVEEVLNMHSCLKQGPGKMVTELRPSFNWHKGKALVWLVEKVASHKSLFPIFIGDDKTDEDAFKEIKSNGAGILVGDHGGDSEAKYRLKDTEEVHAFLSKLKDCLK